MINNPLVAGLEFWFWCDLFAKFTEIYFELHIIRNLRPCFIIARRYLTVLSKYSLEFASGFMILFVEVIQQRIPKLVEIRTFQHGVRAYFIECGHHWTGIRKRVEHATCFRWFCKNNSKQCNVVRCFRQSGKTADILENCGQPWITLSRLANFGQVGRTFGRLENIEQPG